VQLATQSRWQFGGKNLPSGTPIPRSFLMRQAECVGPARDAAPHRVCKIPQCACNGILSSERSQAPRFSHFNCTLVSQHAQRLLKMTICTVSTIFVVLQVPEQFCAPRVVLNRIQEGYAIKYQQDLFQGAWCVFRGIPITVPG